MCRENNHTLEFEYLMNYISSKYSKEEINWYMSFSSHNEEEKKFVIEISSNSYANEKRNNPKSFECQKFCSR